MLRTVLRPSALTDAGRSAGTSGPALCLSETSFRKVRAMAAHRAVRDAVLTVAACAGLTSLAACGSESAKSSSTTPSDGGTFSSPSQELGNGTVKTYVTLNGGQPTEVGLRLTPTALEGLPQSGATLMIDFPDQAADTAFDHVMLNWNPQ